MRPLSLVCYGAMSLLIIFGGCTKTEEDDPCGAAIKWKTHKVNLAVVTTDYSNADSMRTVYFEDLSEPSDICAKEHVNVDFFITADDTVHTIEWTARCYWGAMPETKPMGTTTAGNKFAGAVMNIGLKQTFGDNPAYLGMQFLAKFKTSGSDSLDRIIAYEAIGIGDITLDYKKHK